MLLEVTNLDAGYGFLQILREVSIQVEKGEYVCLVGANGSGKSTLLKTIAGHVKLTKGQIHFMGQPIAGLPANRVARMRIAYVPEELHLFVNMTVEDNLLMGGYTVKDKSAKKESLQFVYELFPVLKDRKKQLAGTMSGGERKMLAIGRGLMLNPTLLLVDEPSFGLAPQVTETVFDSLNALKKVGLTILLVEQDVTKAFSVTDRGYVLENGKIELTGKSSELADDPFVKKAFLGYSS